MNTSINENFTDIRPATRALKQISIARLRGGKGHYEGTHHCALLMLDPEYVPFLKKTVGHTHARIRKIASTFLSQLSEETRNRPVEQRTLSNLKF